MATTYSIDGQVTGMDSHKSGTIEVRIDTEDAYQKTIRVLMPGYEARKWHIGDRVTVRIS